MKNWIQANKNTIPFFLLFLFTQIVNKFGDYTGQYAKIEVAIYLIILYIPIYIYHLKKIKVENLNLGVLLLLIVPIFFWLDLLFIEL